MALISHAKLGKNAHNACGTTCAPLERDSERGTRKGINQKKHSQDIQKVFIRLTYKPAWRHALSRCSAFAWPGTDASRWCPLSGGCIYSCYRRSLVGRYPLNWTEERESDWGNWTKKFVLKASSLQSGQANRKFFSPTWRFEEINFLKKKLFSFKKRIGRAKDLPMVGM